MQTDFLFAVSEEIIKLTSQQKGFMAFKSF